MNNGWESSAQAWIDSMGERGERGDWGRQHVLDPQMVGGRVKEFRDESAEQTVESLRTASAENAS